LRRRNATCLGIRRPRATPIFLDRRLAPRRGPARRSPRIVCPLLVPWSVLVFHDSLEETRSSTGLGDLRSLTRPSANGVARFDALVPRTGTEPSGSSDRGRDHLEHLTRLESLIHRRVQPQLALADIPGALDDELAALETPVPIRAKGLLVRLGARQFLGEHDRILDRHAGALAEVRRRRVHGVADQNDTPFVPVARDELPLQWLVDDLVVVANLLRELRDPRRRMLQLAAHRGR